MKSNYSKPLISFEPLVVSGSSGSSCEGIANFVSGLCSVTVNIGYEIEVYQSDKICDWCPPNPEDYACYHAPTDANNVYSS